MRVAILGGSFDPPHLGHRLITRQVKEYLPVDQILLMPCSKHSFGKKLSPAFHRLSMTTFLADKDILVSDLEVRKGGISHSIETLEMLKGKNPNDTFSWIIGSDQLADFYKWPKWQEIISEFGLVIFPREVALATLKNTVTKTLQITTVPKTVMILRDKDLVLTNISSSIIRRRVKKGLPIDFLVPKGVDEYIREHNLYA